MNPHMGLIKFLFILIIVYYLFKLFARYLMPYLLALFIKKTQKRMMDQQDDFVKTQRKKEGKTSVDYIPKDKGNPNKSDLGEYTDYEDIQE